MATKEPRFIKQLDIKNTVRKSNVLNEIRNANVSTVEYRLFCVFLSHFSMVDETNNSVTFKLSDYAKIVNLDRPRKTDFEKQAHSVVGKTIQFDNEDGGFDVFPLFTRFKLHKNDDDEWCVTLTCADDLAPKFREEKKRFVRYKLYNIIFLKSYNQQRIYELLKQYQKIGERTIDLQRLRDYLSIKDDEYPKWGSFSQAVLKVAQKNIQKYTDICFDFEPIIKKRKTVAVKFNIYPNNGYKDYLQIEEFIKDEDYAYEEDEIEVSSSDVTEESTEIEGQMSWDEVEIIAEETEKLFPAANVLVDEMLRSQGYKFTPKRIDTLCSEARKHVPFHLHPDKWNEFILSYIKDQVNYMDGQENVEKPYFYLRDCVKWNHSKFEYIDETNDFVSKARGNVPSLED